jgi:hypothetical protein
MIKNIMAGIFRILFPVLAAFSIASCASTDKDFTAYKDNTIFLGHGGVVRSESGIEIWTEGSPDREFRIIGVVAMKNSAGKSLPLPGMLSQLNQLGQLAQSSPESHLVSEARAHGGDAVIIIQSKQSHDIFASSESGTGGDNAAGGAENSDGSPSPKHGQATEAYIVKYVAGAN